MGSTYQLCKVSKAIKDVWSYCLSSSFVNILQPKTSMAHLWLKLVDFLCSNRECSPMEAFRCTRKRVWEGTQYRIRALAWPSDGEPKKVEYYNQLQHKAIQLYSQSLLCSLLVEKRNQLKREEADSFTLLKSSLQERHLTPTLVILQ